MKFIEYIFVMVGVLLLFDSCSKNGVPESVLNGGEQQQDSTNTDDTADLYPGVPKSSIYSVSITQGNISKKVVTFQSTCPEYQEGYMGMPDVYRYPLNIFKGRSVSWANFSFSNSVEVEVTVKNQDKVALGSQVKILPSRYNIIPRISENTIKFTITQPGQYSVEIGNDGYKNGLMVFANPPETDIPDTTSTEYAIIKGSSQDPISNLPAQYSGIYFDKGIHNIGVYHVPANIKNIYFDPDSWVYGALILDGNPNVKIWGRGVLSGAKLDYKKYHSIEAINGSDNITLKGIVIAENKFFSVRFISSGNEVSWVKVIGGWTYNTDGIRVGPNSTVSHCFVWANDDNIKVYRNNITYSDMVCWQLNNGGLIQLSWGNGNATNVTIKNVDILHGEWNSDASNRGIISCVGDKFAQGGMYGLQKNFLIENVVTETPVPIIFNIRPNPASPNIIDRMTFKNWDIKLDRAKGYKNYIECSDPTRKFKGFVFDNFTINGTKLTEFNWITLGDFQIKNIETPAFY